MYPPRNPFPAQATTTIEGVSASSLDQVTLARPSIDGLQELAKLYRTAYTSSRMDNGRAVAVHGDHGTGKTHALACVMATLGAAPPEHRDKAAGLDEPEVPAVRVMYVRADSPDVFAIYRKLMSQITLKDLRHLSVRARANYAGEEVAQSRRLDDQAARKALGRLDPDTDWVSRAFEATELQATAVLDRQRGDLTWEGMRRQDFERVIPNLLNPDLADLAYRWFTGETLTESQLHNLGITENIDNSLKCRMGIQALLTLSWRGGLPIAVLIDQAEALVTAEDGSLHQDNVGTLRAIVESVSGCSGFLVLAIREGTWCALPEDLRQRFGASVFQMTGLTESEAAELVAIYVQPWANTDEERTFPFLPDGLREALRNSGGNIRRFLQICCLLFTVAAPEERTVDGEFARVVLSRDATPVPDKESVRAKLRELLTAAHIPFKVRYHLGNTIVDFVISNPAGGIRTVIVVSDALFGTREVGIARTMLTLQRRLLELETQPADVVLVVAGYMSPELTSELGEIHRVVVVTADSGRQALAALVDDLKATALESALADTAELRDRLESIQRSLTQLEADRAREAQQLQARLGNLNVTYVNERRDEGLDETRRQWRAAEESIRAEIRTARQQRQQAELDELERLRARAEKDRGRLIGIILPSAFIGCAALGYGASTALNYSSITAGILWGLVIAIALVGVPAAIFWYSTERDRDIAKPVKSIRELDSLALRYATQRRPTTFVNLRSRNPQIRYAAVSSRQAYDLDVLSRALVTERSAIMRRCLVKRMVTEYGPDGSSTVFTALGSDPAATAAFDYVKSGAGSFGGFPTLAIIYGWNPDISPTDLLPNFIEAIRPVFKSAEPESDRKLEDLTSAYRSAADKPLLRALSAYSERDFRDAAVVLSPFDAGRLGTFDWLGKIDEIDEIYLFFRKCLYYIARGATAIAPSSSDR
jgi:hypothetical protein